MGNQQQKQPTKQVKDSSKFLTEEEIRERRKFWNHLYPNGVATRSNFYKFAEKVAIDYIDPSSVEFMFRAMDSDKNGEITFDEFLWYMAITSPSQHYSSVQIDDLVDMCFLMYDEDGDGYITRDEVSRTMRNVFSTQGHDIHDEEVQQNMKRRIDQLFGVCDKDGDGRLTKKEIKDACKANPAIVDFL